MRIAISNLQFAFCILQSSFLLKVARPSAGPRWAGGWEQAGVDRRAEGARRRDCVEVGAGSGRSADGWRSAEGRGIFERSEAALAGTTAAARRWHGLAFAHHHLQEAIELALHFFKAALQVGTAARAKVARFRRARFAGALRRPVPGLSRLCLLEARHRGVQLGGAALNLGPHSFKLGVHLLDFLTRFLELLALFGWELAWLSLLSWAVLRLVSLALGWLSEFVLAVLEVCLFGLRKLLLFVLAGCGRWAQIGMNGSNRAPSAGPPARLPRSVPAGLFHA